MGGVDALQSLRIFPDVRFFIGGTASVPSHWSLDIFAAEPMLSQSLTRGNRRAAAKQVSPGRRR